MRSLFCGLTGVFVTFLLAAGPAQALVCYVVYDRNNNAIFQDTHSPVDLSDKGLAAREAMNQRGEHLQWAEADKCPAIVFFTGSGGTTDFNVDEIVTDSRIRNFAGRSGAGATSSTSVPAGTVPTGFTKSPQTSKSGSY